MTEKSPVVGNCKENLVSEDREALATLEEKLFGLYRPSMKNERVVSDRDFIPIKSGIPSVRFLKSSPMHIMDAEDFEPL